MHERWYTTATVVCPWGPILEKEERGVALGEPSWPASGFFVHEAVLLLPLDQDLDTGSSPR